MAAKSFEQFLTDMAGPLDYPESMLADDAEIRRIYGSGGDYQARVDRAISYWRSKPDYIDVNRDFIDRLGKKP